MKVSLVIASHCRGAKIGPTLESVFAQTRIPDEVFVVNDGGFLETSEYISQRYPEVRVLNIEHGGVCVARNHGAAASTCPVVMFLDDDDLLRPHAVETLLGVLIGVPEAQAAFADHSYTNYSTGKRYENHHDSLTSFARLRRVRPMRRNGDVRLFGKCLYRALLWGNILQQPWMIRREIFMGLGGFSVGLHSANDWDIFLRLTRAQPVAVTDSVISDHFIEVDRPHLTKSPRGREMQIRVLRQHLRLVRFRDPWAMFVLRMRLGVNLKASGDKLRQTSLLEAWWKYGDSFCHWPFDYVVATRLLWWPMQMLFVRLGWSSTPPSTSNADGTRP